MLYNISLQQVFLLTQFNNTNIFLFLAFILVAHFNFIDSAKGESSVYSNYIDGIEIYNTREELQKLYDDALKVLEECGPGGVKIESEYGDVLGRRACRLFVAIYSFAR